MVLIAIYWTIRYRQNHIRKLYGKAAPPHGIIFTDSEPDRYDASLKDGIKFILNYGFYKFGFECSLIMLVIVAWVRMDFVAAILAVWLLAFAILPRGASRILWPFFVIYLAVQLIVVYAMHLGLPQMLCISKSYPYLIAV